MKLLRNCTFPLASPHIYTITATKFMKNINKRRIIKMNKWTIIIPSNFMIHRWDMSCIMHKFIFTIKSINFIIRTNKIW
jgi:hypothetical protein